MSNSDEKDVKHRERRKLAAAMTTTSTTTSKGSCQVKKIKKSEKKSEVGGWVKPQLGYFLCFFFSVFCVYFFSKHIQNI